MPLYEYKCEEGHRSEILRKFEQRHDPTACPTCGHSTHIQVSSPAFTPSGWGDSKWAGRFDKGLGVTLRDKSHRDQILKARGLVEDSSYDQRNRLDKAVSDNNEHERTVKKYEANIEKHGGDKGLAIADTFPADL